MSEEGDSEEWREVRRVLMMEEVEMAKSRLTWTVVDCSAVVTAAAVDDGDGAAAGWLGSGSELEASDSCQAAKQVRSGSCQRSTQSDITTRPKTTTRSEKSSTAAGNKESRRPATECRRRRRRLDELQWKRR